MMSPFDVAFPPENVSCRILSGVYSKQVCIPAGWRLASHRHIYDHLSILAAGTIWLTVDGERRLVRGPEMLTISAGKEHIVHAVTDATWYCIHATDETDADNVDETLIEKEPV